MVGAEDGHDVGLVVIDQVERLEDRVGRSRVPVRAQPLLRGHGRDVVPEQAAQAPGRRDVPVQAVALVLGQHADAPDSRVDEIGEREVDKPVQASERHGGLGTVIGQRRQSLPGSASEDNREYLRLSHPELLSKADFG